MILQNRDLDILQLCYEQQILTVEHLKGMFIGGKRQQVMRRLSELKSMGVVTLQRVLAGDGGYLVRLTQQGARIAAGRSEHDVPQLRGIDLATVEHDAIVTAVRLRLRALWDCTWLPERALKDRYPIVPDGLVQFASGVSFAIEVENTLKGAARQRMLLDTWDRTQGVHLVLYICTKPTVYQAWQRYIAERPRSMAYALLHWQELATALPMAWSPKGELSLFDRREFG